MKLDTIDKKLLQLLQENARMGINELCHILGLTKTPIYERMKRYETEGIIQKYVAVLNSSKLEGMVVFCSVSLESQKLESIESFSKSVQAIPEVIECYLMGGANDFLLKIVVKDLQDYHQFSSGKLAKISNVAQIKSMFVLNQVKEPSALPVF